MPEILRMLEFKYLGEMKAIRTALLVFGLSFFFGSILFAQEQEYRIDFRDPKVFVPASLITVGTVLHGTNARYWFREDIVQALNIGRTRLDDYLQFSTMGIYGGLKILGVKGKYDLRPSLVRALISEVATVAIVHGIKRIVDTPRPLGGNHSFPSGHTAQTFIGAAILHQEYMDTQPWLVYGGYALAGVTGALRITNDVHWVSDVLVGAGLATLITHLVYQIPIKKTHTSDVSLMMGSLTVDEFGKQITKGGIIYNF